MKFSTGTLNSTMTTITAAYVGINASTFLSTVPKAVLPFKLPV